MNFIPTTVKSLEAETMTLITIDNDELVVSKPNHALAIGDLVTFGIRPEHLMVSEEEAIKIRFQSEVVERLGNSTYLFGQSSGVDGFKVHLSGDKEVKSFESLTLSCKASDVHLFDTNGVCITSK